MTHQQPDLLPSLGVGSILSQSFSVLFSRFLLFFLLAVAVQGVLLLVSLFFTPDLATFDPAAGTTDFTPFVVAGVLGLLVALVGSSLTTGMIVLGAYDAWLGNPSRAGAYVGAAFGAIVPLVLVSIITGILSGLGALLLIVPGLYVAALFSVTTPAIVAEGAGFGAMGRSAELKSGYRWSIIGLFIVVFAIVFAIGALYQVIAGTVVDTNLFVASTQQAAVAGSFWYQLVSAVVNAVTTAFIAVVTAVLFARLKEIKEGVGYEDLGPGVRVGSAGREAPPPSRSAARGHAERSAAPRAARRPGDVRRQPRPRSEGRRPTA